MASCELAVARHLHRRLPVRGSVPATGGLAEMARTARAWGGGKVVWATLRA